MKKFTRIPTDIIFNKEVSNSVFRTYCALASYGLPEKVAYPSEGRIAERLGSCRETINRNVSAIKKLSLLKVRRRKNTSNLYFAGDLGCDDNVTTDVKQLSQPLLQKSHINNTNGLKTHLFNYEKLTDEEKTKFNQIVKWVHNPNFFHTRPLNETVTRNFVGEALERIGFTQLIKIWDRHANISIPHHPAMFLTELKELLKVR